MIQNKKGGRNIKHYLTAPQKNTYIFICLLFMMITPVYFFGIRPLIIMAVALTTAFLCEFFIKRLLFRLPVSRKYNLSPAITAMLVTLLMPASIDYYIVAIAVFFGLLIGKYILGGTGRNIFNSAAVGVVFVAISYPTQMFLFPATGQNLLLSSDLSKMDLLIISTSPGYVLGVGGVPQMNFSSVFLGDFTGMMGATQFGILIAFAVFLCMLQIFSARVILSGIGTVAVYAMLLPRAQMSLIQSVIFELTSGVLLFGIIFLANSPNTLSTTKFGQVLYGSFLSIAVMTFRQFGIGSLEVEFLFVLLFANALSAEFDSLGVFLSRKMTWLLHKIKS